MFPLLGKGPKDSSSSECGESCENDSKTSGRPQPSGETKSGKSSRPTKPTNAPKPIVSTKGTKPQSNGSAVVPRTTKHPVASEDYINFVISF